jgi:hypothetical protein
MPHPTGWLIPVTPIPLWIWYAQVAPPRTTPPIAIDSRSVYRHDGTRIGREMSSLASASVGVGHACSIP